MEAIPTKIQVLRKCITACIFSPVLWLSPSISSVSEIRKANVALCVFLAVAVTFLCSSCHLAAC